MPRLATLTLPSNTHRNGITLAIVVLLKTLTKNRFSVFNYSTNRSCPLHTTFPSTLPVW
nr:unnamed protein product [Digitaria exilis]